MKQQVTYNKEIESWEDINLVKASLYEYIKERLEKDCGYYSPALTKHIDELTRSFAKTLKDKYDMAFSAQIVSALNNQGLLKEDVVKKLGEYQQDGAK